MKLFIKRIGVGFSYGIGFFLAITVFGVLLQPFIQAINGDDRRAKITELSQEHSAFIASLDSPDFSLSGSVTNSSDVSWPNTEVVANIRNSKNTIIRTCKSNINESLGAKRTKDIVLSCKW